MKCTHTNLRQFTFSDGKTIQSCPGCPLFDTDRRATLCPPGVKVETVRDARRQWPIWSAGLPEAILIELNDLENGDRSKDHVAVRYGFSVEQLENLPPISLWAHQVAVERMFALHNRNDRKRPEQAARSARIKRERSEAKQEMRRRLWGNA